MKIVVVGGNTRNIGKTSVMAGLIHHIQPPRWTAVKITQYGHGICSRDGKPCGCAPGEHSFVLTEEKDPTGQGDTQRFLAAGAERSLWLRVRQGQLERAMPRLLRALHDTSWVMIESNSILRFIDPSAYVFVLGNSEQDFKKSARTYLPRADAIVRVTSGQWRVTSSDGHGEASDPALKHQPLFTVPLAGGWNPKLGDFVRDRLGLQTPAPSPGSPGSPPSP